jgi:hypothetical protein
VSRQAFGKFQDDGCVTVTEALHGGCDLALELEAISARFLARACRRQEHGARIEIQYRNQGDEGLETGQVHATLDVAEAGQGNANLGRKRFLAEASSGSTSPNGSGHTRFQGIGHAHSMASIPRKQLDNMLSIVNNKIFN